MDTTGLRQVGEFSSLNRRRLIRTKKSPMDRCTIVSIFPKEIQEVKHTIEPGIFNLPAGTYDNPSTLVVGPSSWWKDIDVEQPMLEIPSSSVQVAESVVNDYSNGMLGCDMESAKPGLFFVQGEVNILKIRTEYRSIMDETRIKQDNWYKILVNIADSLWARTNGNPLVIWDMMRLAARQLNYNDKPWLQNFQAAKLEPCKACGSLRNQLFPVCQVCKVIDPNHPLAKDLKFAV